MIHFNPRQMTKMVYGCSKLGGPGDSSLLWRRAVAAAVALRSEEDGPGEDWSVRSFLLPENGFQFSERYCSPPATQIPKIHLKESEFLYVSDKHLKMTRTNLEFNNALFKLPINNMKTFEPRHILSEQAPLQMISR